MPLGSGIAMSLAAAAASLLAWLVSIPFLPNQPIGAGAPESHFTLGTVYGLVSSFFLGAFVTASLASVYGMRLGRRFRKRICAAFLFGGVAVTIGDALSDVIGVFLLSSGLSSLLPIFLWHVLAALAIVMAYVGASGLREVALSRIAMVVGVVACAGLRARVLMSPVAVILKSLLVAGSSGEGESPNFWLLVAPSSLVRNIASMAVLGFGVRRLGSVEPKAWLRRYVSIGEWLDYPVYSASVSIGSSQRADISIGDDRELMPIHALVRIEKAGSLVSGGPGPVIVDGQVVPQRSLRHGECFQVGNTVLQYLAGP